MSRKKQNHLVNRIKVDKLGQTCLLIAIAELPTACFLCHRPRSQEPQSYWSLSVHTHLTHSKGSSDWTFFSGRMSEHFSVDSKNLKRPQQLCEAVSHTQFYRHKKFFRNRVWIEAATNINPAALQSASKTSRLESGNVKHHKEPNHLIFTEISMDWEDDIYLGKFLINCDVFIIT